MPQRNNTVVPSCQPIGEERFHAAMMLGLSRMVAEHGRDSVALALGVSPRQLGNLANGSFPAPHRLWNLLSLDQTAMDEVAALYSREVRPTTSQAANDLDTVSRISHLVGQWAEVLSDGRRDHRETCQLAEAIRPIVPALSAIIAESDRLKGAA
jgi:hypothetical protein